MSAAARCKALTDVHSPCKCTCVDCVGPPCQAFISKLFMFLSQPQTAYYRADLVLARPDTGEIYPLTEVAFTHGVQVIASRVTLTATPAYSADSQSDQLNGLRDAIVAFGSGAYDARSSANQWRGCWLTYRVSCLLLLLLLLLLLVCFWLARGCDQTIYRRCT